MKNFSIVLILYLLAACTPARYKNTSCDSLSAKTIADKQMKRRRFKIAEYKVALEEGKEYFLLRYTDSLQYRTGGGGEIKVAKKNCLIIDKIFYQ